MKNWWEEDEEFNFSGEGKDSFEAEKSADDKSFEEVFGASFDDMPLRQQIETAYDYYDKPQNGQAYQIAGEPVAFGGQVNENEPNKEKIIDAFYQHLKKPEVEGYWTQPYCDTEGKNTVGAGFRIPKYQDISDLTMTSTSAPVSADNPAWDDQKKKNFMGKLGEFCSKEKNRKLSPEKQFDLYAQTYGEEMPYFQEGQLDEKGKDYIRQNALPETEKNMQNVGIDFYNDLSEDGQKAFLDMQYNLGGNKFKLIDLNDPAQINASKLKYKKELLENPNLYSEQAINHDLLDNGYWPKFSLATKKRRPEQMAQSSHRIGVNDQRNKMIADYLKKSFQGSSADLREDEKQKKPWTNSIWWW